MVKLDHTRTRLTIIQPARVVRLIQGDAFTMRPATDLRLSARSELAGRGSRPTSTHRTTDGRVHRSAALKEQTAMYQIHPTLSSAVAEMRRRDLLAEAEQERRISAIRTGAERRSVVTTVVAIARRQVGSALVRTGERVQGVSRAETAANGLPAPGALRIVR